MSERGGGPTFSFTKLVPFSVPWWSSKLTQLVRNTRKTKRDYSTLTSADAWIAYQEALSAKGVHLKQVVADAIR